MNIRDYKTIEKRRKAVEEACGVFLPNIAQNNLDLTSASEKNCENMIGTTQIPLGIAGPLSINNDLFKNQKSIFVPLATTEGALVASINRGCKAITLCGGSSTVIKRVGITRGPVFETSGLIESTQLSAWIYDHKQELATVAQTTSTHILLFDLFVLPIGKRVYVRFSFDTKDAMGMNMVTIATTAIAEYIEAKTKTRCLSVAGNFDTDKKPSWLNSLLGRGRKVWAEVLLNDEILDSVLKTTAKKVFDVWLSKNMIGTALSGSMAFNAHAANGIAAFFAATGQDIAHVGEVSICTTTADVVENGLLLSVYMPDVVVGTVGGGTGLPTQKEAISIMGITGGDDGKNGDKLAAIVGNIVLAGEISLLSALAEGKLSESHEKLARGKIV